MMTDYLFNARSLHTLMTAFFSQLAPSSCRSLNRNCSRFGLETSYQSEVSWWSYRPSEHQWVCQMCPHCSIQRAGLGTPHYCMFCTRSKLDKPSRIGDAHLEFGVAKLFTFMQKVCWQNRRNNKEVSWKGWNSSSHIENTWNLWGCKHIVLAADEFIATWDKEHETGQNMLHMSGWHFHGFNDDEWVSMTTDVFVEIDRTIKTVN